MRSRLSVDVSGCHNQSVRFFNTEGPVRPDDHYAVPPLERVDVAELLDLVRSKRYFVLHAPRQTGKTSALIALRDLLNRGEAGDFRCVDVNVEVGQVARDDTARGMRAVLSSLASSARLLGDDYPDGVWPDLLARVGPEDALRQLLTRAVLSASAAGLCRARLLRHQDFWCGARWINVSRIIVTGH